MPDLQNDLVTYFGEIASRIEAGVAAEPANRRPSRQVPRAVLAACIALVVAVGGLVVVLRERESESQGVVTTPDSSRDDPAPGGPGDCDDDALEVPTPRLVTALVEVPMDLLFIQHPACGYNADGAVNLGADPAVVQVAARVDVAVSAEFGVRYSLTPATADEAPLADASALISDGVLQIDVPATGCHRLVLELTRGDLTGRYVSLLQTSGEGCSTTSSTSPDESSPVLGLPLGHDRLGPVVVGMTIEEAEAALGENIIDVEASPGACSTYRPISAPTVGFYVLDGRIFMIAADNATTDRGVAKGATEAELEAAYQGQAVDAYTNRLSFREVIVRATADAGFATVFQLDTSGSRVERIRSGRYPEVQQYDEGCA